jgi:hypothetical protein
VHAEVLGEEEREERKREAEPEDRGELREPEGDQVALPVNG